jgi:hypothetical protein
MAEPSLQNHLPIADHVVSGPRISRFLWYHEPMVPVGQPLLPTADAIARYLAELDRSRRYTNHGQLVRLLEERLAALLGSPAAQTVSGASATAALAWRVQRDRFVHVVYRNTPDDTDIMGCGRQKTTSAASLCSKRSSAASCHRRSSAATSIQIAPVTVIRSTPWCRLRSTPIAARKSSCTAAPRNALRALPPAMAYDRDVR